MILNAVHDFGQFIQSVHHCIIGSYCIALINERQSRLNRPAVSIYLSLSFIELRQHGFALRGIFSQTFIISLNSIAILFFAVLDRLLCVSQLRFGFFQLRLAIIERFQRVVELLLGFSFCFKIGIIL